MDTRRQSGWLLWGGVVLVLLAAVALWVFRQPLSTALLGQNDGPVTAISAGENSRIQLNVTKPGIVRLNPTTLEKMGVSISEWAPEQVAVTSLGEPVPLAQVGETIFFYGQGSDSIYAAFRPYLIELNSSETVRREMSEKPLSDSTLSTPADVQKTIFLEENEVYNSIAYAEGFPDTWYWATIHVQKSFAFTQILTDVGDGSGRLTVHLFGQSHDPQIDNDHDLDLVINGQPITTIQWDGPTHHVAEIDLPAGTLRRGENEFLLDNTPPGAAFIDIMGFDWASLTYDVEPAALDDHATLTAADGTVSIAGFTDTPQLFDITDPDAPLLLTGSNFADGTLILSTAERRELAAVGPAAPNAPLTAAVVPADGMQIFDDLTQTDLIIIGTEPMLDVLDSYVAHREAQGVSTRRVPVESIYLAYGEGLPSPEAIQAFFADAVNRWTAPAPQYVLIVGPGRYDFKNNLGVRPIHQVPSLMVAVTHSGETVSDNRMADIDGDYRPDLAIGRWPVETPDEVAALANRTIAYENGQAAAPTLFAADGTSQEFTGLADALVEGSGLPEDEAVKLYGVSAEVLSDSWNSGTWLVNYVGHGSIHLWGKDEVFSDDALPLLTYNDTYAPPIVAQFTCLTGYYAHPTERSLSELLLNSDNGPVLVLGATSLTYSSHQRPFALRFLQGLQDPAFERIGDVLLYARAELNLEEKGIREVSDTFGLLGDPSAIIVRPAS